MRVDPSVYAIVDPAQTGGHHPVSLAVAAASGGATLVQLRDKAGGVRATIALARALIAGLRPWRVPLVVNDRVDVAAACDAAGVHLGQDDMHPVDARRLLGPQAIIGQTVKTPADADAVPLGAVDYVGVGGVFATASKDNPHAPIGLDGLAARVAQLRARAPRLPVAAIAGIDETNAEAVMRAGADGICVIAAVAKSADPAAAVRRLRAIVDRAKGGRT